MINQAEDMSKFSFSGYEIPVDLLNMTGGGTDTFGVISQGHIINLQNYVGIKADDNLLEIGCGIGRDAIPLTNILSQEGSYVGVDIIGRSIEWCKNNITPRYPNFNFSCFNVKDPLHNPEGVSSTLDIILPIPDNSIDRIILWSVFTHMFATDIIHYMREFRRVLKPDGLVWATCFIYDDEVLAAAQKHNLTPFNLRFEHEYETGCRINDIQHPTGAVAYTIERLNEFLRESGLRLHQPYIREGWSGLPIGNGSVGQDAMVLEAL